MDDVLHSFKSLAPKPAADKMDEVTAEVYHQLLPDFPVSAIDWVKHTEWIGPVKIPLDQIDFSNRANWVASHEPKKVNLHIKLIKEGKSKPCILAKLPGHDKLFIADSHHRILACEKMGVKPECYIALVKPKDIEACVKMHSLQYSGGSRLDNLNGT